MRLFITFFFISALTVQGFSLLTTSPTESPTNAPTLVGRWRIKFTLTGSPEKNLIFESRPKGSGSFQLLDTGPDDKPVADSQAAAWSQTLENISITSEVELQVGTCCRQTGTLILKAKLLKGSSFSGKLIFVTNIDEEESPYKYHSTVGTFTATRLN